MNRKLRMVRYIYCSTLVLFIFVVSPIEVSGPISPGFGLAAAASLPPGAVNSVTITNKSGLAQNNYPFQFGRPFLAGEIPHYPQVLINGNPVLTQADVKNRYPDN